MTADISFLKFSDDAEQGSGAASVFADYLRAIANKQLRRYKTVIQYGAKEGQSYFSHVMDLVTLAEKLRPTIALDEQEMRCVLLALTIHDLNKLAAYGTRADGKEAKYNDAATTENVRAELEQLQADEFFPAWRDYLQDIVLLAHSHQEAATGSTMTLDQRVFDTCRLRPARVKGTLKHLMKAVDTADNSHSGDHCDPSEVHLRDKLLQHINAAMPERQYRFFGHRLAELRGLFTNVLHNELVGYFREKYGQDACVDLQYYPEGVNYLLDRASELVWTADTLREVAARIERKLADIQLKELEQFIKGKPVGIVVDAAAIESGATTAQIFAVIANAVRRKQYKPDWRAERDRFARSDLQEALAHPLSSAELREQVAELLEQADLIPVAETALRRGEFASAYRKFLEDHRGDELKVLKIDPWTRVYRLFNLPESHDRVYRLIDPYRRAYFIARDLPALDLDEMEEAVLADIALLETQAAETNTAGKPRKAKNEGTDQMAAGSGEAGGPLETRYLVEYLKVNLEVWSSGNNSPEDSTLPRPVLLADFGESLRLYADKRQYGQCCYCGSGLKASEWMSVQAPKSIGVQVFSNRLEAGSSRDPKRNVCAVCRAQYILEKLAWRSHGDKYGMEQVTFYLHLFPYSFFSQPLLRAWWASIDRLRDSEHSAFFLDTRHYFRSAGAALEDIQGTPTSTNGLGLPALSEALSNTPVLPIIAPGDSYGAQFMLALEMAVILGRWFECRVLLSRLPVPPLNLSRERIDGKPVVLVVEGMPRNMSWLVPAASMQRGQVEELHRKLGCLHQLAKALYYTGSKSDDVPHDFAVAAADDELALFYQADRLIEKKVGAEKGRAKISPEQHAIALSREVAPLLERLVHAP